MSYQVIARKWRPQTFDEVAGQEHVTTTLKNAIQSGRIGHAYLFTGIRGVGKTTAARILAKALNCEHGPTPDPCNRCLACSEITQGISLDVQEIDGASNRGIDNVRDLREGVAFAPARDRFKVYIIDEVHMLTQEAFNALLKTLEEPPAHVVFIFATTEMHKVPATIASRCQVFEFRRIPLPVLVERLRVISTQEGFSVEEDALAMIAREAEGSLRDACSFLDQVASFCSERIGATEVAEVLRTGNRVTAQEVLKSILTEDAASAIRTFLQANARGVPARQFLRDVARQIADVMQIRLLGETAVREIGWTASEVEAMKSLVGAVPIEHLASLMHLIVNAADQAADSRSPDLVAEAALIRAASMKSLMEVRDIVSRLEAIATGRPIAQGPSDRSVVRPRLDPTAAPARVAPPVSAASQTPRESRVATTPASPVQPVTASRAPPEAAANNPAVRRPAPANPNGVLGQFRKHPVVERVLEVFGGEILDVKAE